MSSIRFIAAAAILAASGYAESSSTAPPYPNKPVRVIVPATAGGATDMQARIFAQLLSETMKEQFVVDNRAGGGGVVAASLVAKAPPDGYTLLMATPFLTLLPALIENLPYDVAKDFAPIALLSKAPYLLVGHPGGPASSVNDLVAIARSKPDTLNLGITVGSGPHLAAAYLASAAHLKFTFVPYKGAAPAISDVIGGHTHLFFGSILASLSHVKAGRLRALVVSSVERSAALPDVPTISESVLPGYDISSWFGWVGPAKTPPGIIASLRAALQKAKASPEVAKAIAQDGAVVVNDGPQQFSKRIAEEIPRWRKIARESGVTLQ